MNNQDWKKKFRYSKEWRDFRLKMKEKYKVDYITHSKLTKLFNLHHMKMTDKPEEYKELSDESHFACLNYTSHSLLHYMWGKNGKNWRDKLKRLEELLEKMEELNGKE